MAEGDGGESCEGSTEENGEEQINSSDDLETRVEEETRQELITALKEEGIEDIDNLSLDELIALTKGLEKKEISSKEIWYDKYIENLPSSIRWIFYALRGFTDNTKKEGIYRKILSSDKKHVTLLLTGLLDIPYEQYFGEDIVRISTHNTDEIHKYIEFAKRAGYKVRLIGYSGGSKRIRNYINKYTKENIDKILILGGIVHVPGAYHINGEKDRVIAFFNKLYQTLSKIPCIGDKFKEIAYNPVKPDETLPDTGHWDLIFNPQVIQKVKEYINSYTQSQFFTEKLDNKSTTKTGTPLVKCGMA